MAAAAAVTGRFADIRDFETLEAAAKEKNMEKFTKLDAVAAPLT